MPDDQEPVAPTSADPATGKATQDFVGVKMRLDGIAVRSLNVDADRMRFIISVPIGVGSMPLIQEMLLHIRQEIFVGFGFLQGALPFPEAGDVQSVSDPADPSIVTYAINAKGDKFYPHNWIKGGDNNTCASCDLVEGHGIHSPASIEARKKQPSDEPQAPEATEEPKPARGRRNGTHVIGEPPAPQTNEVANTSVIDSLANGLIEDLHREPESDEEAAEQARALENLAARSRA